MEVPVTQICLDPQLQTAHRPLALPALVLLLLLIMMVRLVQAQQDPGPGDFQLAGGCLIRETGCTVAEDSNGNPIRPGSMLSLACGALGAPVEVRPCFGMTSTGVPAEVVIVSCERCPPPRERIINVCGNRCPDGYRPVQSQRDPACMDFEALVCALE
jgi:hypothetical protein